MGLRQKKIREHPDKNGLVIIDDFDYDSDEAVEEDIVIKESQKGSKLNDTYLKEDKIQDFSDDEDEHVKPKSKSLNEIYKLYIKIREGEKQPVNYKIYFDERDDNKVFFKTHISELKEEYSKKIDKFLKKMKRKYETPYDIWSSIRNQIKSYDDDDFRIQMFNLTSMDKDEDLDDLN